MDQEGRSQTSAESDRELVRLWRAWRTIHEMCFDRVWFLTSYIGFDKALELTNLSVRAMSYPRMKLKYLLKIFVANMVRMAYLRTSMISLAQVRHNGS